MPQYFFHLHERCVYVNPTGAHFPDNDAAKRHAEYMASHLGDIDPSGYILVVDETGTTVARCPAQKKSRTA